MNTANATGPHLLLLLGPGGATPDFIFDSAQRLTRRMSVIFYNPRGAMDLSAAKTSWAGLFSGEWHEVRTPEEVHSVADALHAREPVRGVATFTEVLVLIQAELAARFGVPGNPVAGVQ